MPAPAPPKASLSHLHRADGSATYSYNDYTVIGAVNGPVEVQRRDELPEEAFIDVVVTPNVGVGGVKERHLESIVQATLKHVVLIELFPRTMIQVTLQIVGVPEDDSSHTRNPQASSYLSVLPALLQTSLLAILSASIPLSMTFSATILAVSPSGNIIDDPSVKEMKTASSVHVLAFSSTGKLLVNESEGDFNCETWEEVHERAMRICRGSKEDQGEDEDLRMDEEGGPQHLGGFVRKTVTDRVQQEQRWRNSVS